MDTTTLYNMSLHHVSGTRIQGPDEGGNADVCNDFFQVSMDNLLSKYDWTFARKLSNLNQRVVANPDYIDPIGDPTIENPDPVDVLINPTIPNPAYIAGIGDPTIPETYGEWTYVYDLPNDYIDLSKAMDGNYGTLDNDEYEVLMTTIASDSEEIILQYTSSLITVENMPNPAAEALSYILAFYIGPRVSGENPDRQNQLMATYGTFLTLAKIHDSKRQKISVKGSYTLVEE